MAAELEVVGCQRNGLGEPQPRFRNEEDEPVPAHLGPQVEVVQKPVQLELVEVLLLLGARGFALNDGLARWVALYQTLIDSIEDGALQLMVEIHCRLPFVADGIVVQQLLIGDAVEFREGQQGNEPLQPSAGEPVLAERDIAHGPFLIHGHPLLVIVAERVVGREFVEHCWVPFCVFGSFEGSR